MRISAVERLRGLYPDIGPWTTAALWHGVHAFPTPTEPIEPELSTIAESKLAGLAVDFIAADKARSAVVSSAVVQELRQFSFDLTLRSHMVAVRGEAVIEDLAAHGVSVAVSKGPGIAAAYDARKWRPYSDIDLLVRAGDFRRALTILRRAGWSEASYNVQPRSYFSSLCQEGVNLRDEGKGSVDLHHQIPPWMWGRSVDVTSMIARAESVRVGGVSLPCLSNEDNAVVALLHIVSDRNKPGASLMVWRDIATLLSRVDQHLLTERLEQCDLVGWCAAITAALPEVVRPPLAATLEPRKPPHSVRLSALLSPPVARAGVGASQVLRLPLPNAAAFSLGMAVPSRRFLAVKFPGKRRRLLRWWSGRGRSDSVGG